MSVSCDFAIGDKVHVRGDMNDALDGSNGTIEGFFEDMVEIYFDDILVDGETRPGKWFMAVNKSQIEHI